ncbi:MAG TPA: WYL domain-containing protein [Jiangellaceae bacterium]
MIALPSYVQRFGRVARALAILADYPQGIRLSQLAAHLGTTEGELREEIWEYHVTVDQLSDGYHQPVIEFVAGPRVGSETDEVSPADAPFVRLRDLRSPPGIGAWLLSFGQLAAVAAAGLRQCAEEPENDVLVAALKVVADSVLAGAVPGGAAWPEVVARRIRQAGSERRRVRIVYAMAWRAGTVERVVEPYRVIRTGRGWEVDAAIVGRNGAIATFLTSGILTLEVLPERFRRPPDVDQRIERHRQPTAVELVVPHDTQWLVEEYAESVDVLDDDEDRLRIRARLVPPVGPRLGLVLLAAGPHAHVIDPVNLREAGRDLARALLAHHGGR